MSIKLIIGFAVAIVVVLTVILLNGSSNTKPVDTNQDQNSNQNTQSKSTNNGNTEDVDYTVEMMNYSFSPNTIEVKAGETIHVKLMNLGGTHDFIIDELGIQSSVLNTGEEKIIEITAPQDAKGSTYEYYCNIANHRQLGMVGNIHIL